MHIFLTFQYTLIVSYKPKRQRARFNYTRTIMMPIVFLWRGGKLRLGISMFKPLFSTLKYYFRRLEEEEEKKGLTQEGQHDKLIHIYKIHLDTLTLSMFKTSSNVSIRLKQNKLILAVRTKCVYREASLQKFMIKVTQF